MWQSIETAPKDGRPVWARGYNRGNRSAGMHTGFVYWDGEEWMWGGHLSGNHAIYVHEWLPPQTGESA